MAERRTLWGRCSAALLDAVVRLRKSSLRACIPRPLRSLGYRMLPRNEFERRTWETAYHELIAETRRSAPVTSVRLGIVTDPMYRFGNYEAACLEMGVPYEYVDISAPDWVQRVRDCGCEGFLVWPSSLDSVSKKLFDERLRLLARDMGRTVLPGYEAVWLYESKLRMNDWLAAHGVRRPETWVFWDRDRAMEFVRQAQMPLVFKTDLGSSASGVEVVRSERRARRLVAACFGRGYLAHRREPRDREWGWILFQQYIPDAREWRMVRVGDSYFGHRKERRGEFHSGTRLVAWDRPPDALLDLTRQVTDLGPFLSMNIDVLEDAAGNYYVSELQTVFGQKHEHQMIVDGRPGRFVRDGGNGTWRFEEGSFCRNALCNLRVELMLRLIAERGETTRNGSG